MDDVVDNVGNGGYKRRVVKLTKRIWSSTYGLNDTEKYDKFLCTRRIQHRDVYVVVIARLL